MMGTRSSHRVLNVMAGEGPLSTAAVNSVSV